MFGPALQAMFAASELSNMTKQESRKSFLVLLPFHITILKGLDVSFFKKSPKWVPFLGKFIVTEQTEKTCFRTFKARDWVYYIIDSTNLEEDLRAIGDRHISLVSIPKSINMHGFNGVSSPNDIFLFADACAKAYVAGLPRAEELLSEVIFYVRTTQIEHGEKCFNTAPMILSQIENRLLPKLATMSEITAASDLFPLVKYLVALSSASVNDALKKEAYDTEAQIKLLKLSDHWRNQEIFEHCLDEMACELGQYDDDFIAALGKVSVYTDPAVTWLSGILVGYPEGCKKDSQLSDITDAKVLANYDSAAKAIVALLDAKDCHENTKAAVLDVIRDRKVVSENDQNENQPTSWYHPGVQCLVSKLMVSQHASLCCVEQT